MIQMTNGGAVNVMIKGRDIRCVWCRERIDGEPRYIWGTKTVHASISGRSSVRSVRRPIHQHDCMAELRAKIEAEKPLKEAQLVQRAVLAAGGEALLKTYLEKSGKERVV